MDILITGARGMVGTATCQAIANHRLITPTKYELNVARLSQVRRFKADFIIHLACETDHEYCDENPSQCYLVNTIGTGNMVRLARELNVPILYLGTASIFDGRKNTPYYPDDTPNPINHYNTSKWYGEILVRAYKQHYILRAGWMFGGGPKIDKKFVNKIYAKIVRGDKEIAVANDCIGSPTYSENLATVIKRCIEDESPSGTHNCVNAGGGCSRYEFACEMVKILGVDTKITPVSIDSLKEEFPCKRTNYEVLENNFSMPHWKDALKEYIDAHYKH